MIAIGHHSAPSIAQAAAWFPDQCFALIDTEAEGENVWSAVFREYEGDYVVGVLAAMISRTSSPTRQGTASDWWQGD